MPTLNLQVGAGADDGHSHGSSFSNSASSAQVGRTFEDYDAFFRFTGVSGLSGATISDATLTLVNFWESTGNNRDFRIYCDDSAAPTAPTDATSHGGKTRTTNYLDVTAGGTFWSPGTSYTFDITAIVQELADSYDPSAIQVLFDEDASANYGNVEWFAYDGNSANAAKLDIDYTAGGGGGTAVPVFAHHYRRMKAA